MGQGAAKGAIILVATDASDTAAAYTLLERNGHRDMLYCHPAHSGKGLALTLLSDAENAARDHGVTRLFTEASELAKPVFARAGCRLLYRRDYTIGPAAPVQMNSIFSTR